MKQTEGANGHVAQTGAPAYRISEILLPKEHGSWSLALEPVALGLIAAASLPGVFLAAGTFAAFLMRRPLQLATAGVRDARAGLARTTLASLAAIAAGCVFAAGWAGGFSPLLPLLAAAPPAVLFWVFDRRKEARALEAEIAGAATFAVVPAAIAMLAGQGQEVATLLALAALARSVPTILTVRTYLRLRKGRGGSRATAIVAAAVPVAIFTVLVAPGIAPPALAVLALLLLGRTLLFLSPRFPRLPASRIGMTEAVIGAAYVTAAGIALA